VTAARRAARYDVPTPHGTGRLVVERPVGAARGVLLLGHGAGGDVDAPDLLAVRDAALADEVVVARFMQPYRVAGRRAPAPAVQLDAAWLAAVTFLRSRRGLRRVPLVVGGRSSGARVACRTADDAGAVAVVALAFPLHPPGKPERTRIGELDGTLAGPPLAAPAAGPTPARVLVVQGDRDAFGMPPAADGRRVVIVPGADHALGRDPAAVASAVAPFLEGLL
jgi:hypothetical protein